MNPIFAAALAVQGFCRERSLPFCIIGGIAVARWGEPRLTRDVDVTVFVGFGGEEAAAAAFLERFPGRLPEARDFALRHRVLLLAATDGVPLDVALGAMPFERRAVERASSYVVAPGVELATCSAEDLIVLKAFAGRERDWLDIEGVLLRQGPGLDETLIWSELEPLLELKEDAAAAPRLRQLIAASRSSG